MMIFIGCHSGNDEVTNAEKAGLISGTENPKIKKCQNGTV